jgi:hypothetical protein
MFIFPQNSPDPQRKSTDQEANSASPQGHGVSNNHSSSLPPNFSISEAFLSKASSASQQNFLRKFGYYLFVGLMIFSISLVGGYVNSTSIATAKKVLKSPLTVFSRLNEPVQTTSTYGPYSIGIYGGSSPFELRQFADISNPILSGRDVTDIDATFVADPFMIVEEDRYYMFFEVLSRVNKQGDIGYAESLDGKKWEYKKIIIDEPFHLSFPYVFKWEGSYYLIPESNKDFSIRLYQATSFPGQWQFVKKLINNHQYVDPAIFRHKDKWWMFCSEITNDTLHLYYASDLLGNWTPHPKNPIVKSNKHIARAGGRVFTFNDRLYRLAQDDEPTYGIQVFALEITDLSETSYEEKLVKNPIVAMSGSGWNAGGMHTVDPHFVQDRWMAAVDGRLSRK